MPVHGTYIKEHGPDCFKCSVFFCLMIFGFSRRRREGAGVGLDSKRCSVVAQFWILAQCCIVCFLPSLRIGVLCVTPVFIMIPPAVCLCIYVSGVVCRVCLGVTCGYMPALVSLLIYRVCVLVGPFFFPPSYLLSSPFFLSPSSS